MLYGECGVIQCLQLWCVVVIVEWFVGGYFGDIVVWMEKVVVKKCGMQLMCYFVGDSGFFVVGNVYQDIDVVIMVSCV